MFLTLSSALSKLNLPYFCSFTYVDEGIVVEGKKYPTTRMKWIDGKNLKEYTCIHKNDKNKLKFTRGISQLINNMLNTNEKINYEVTFNLNKKDGEWVLENPDRTTLEKIHGLYNYENE